VSGDRLTLSVLGIIGNLIVSLGYEIVVLPNPTVRRRLNKRTVFVTSRLFF